MCRLVVRGRTNRRANYVIWYGEYIIWYAVSLHEAYRKKRQMSEMLGYDEWSEDVYMMELD